MAGCQESMRKYEKKRLLIRANVPACGFMLGVGLAGHYKNENDNTSKSAEVC